jgi:CAP12/Pycsar effector protein, TIR domain
MKKKQENNRKKREKEMINVNKIKILNDLISKCTKLKNGGKIDRMELSKLRSDLESFVRHVFDNDKDKLQNIKNASLYYDYIIINKEHFKDNLENFLGFLESWNEEIENFWEDKEDREIIRDLNHTCFIVHGHNNEMKLEVKDFISDDLEKDCIILHKKANEGKTIIEKFELYSEVDFAVCLWSADDFGRTKDSKEEKARARQNVILETGYFWGKYGRDRLIIIHEEGVEIPSDFDGLLHISYKSNWKDDLRKEIENIYSDNQEGVI